MAYFEFGSIYSDAFLIRFRQLSDSPSSYNIFELNVAQLSSSGSIIKSTIHEIPGNSVTYSSDGAGRYQTSWITVYGLVPGYDYRVRTYAWTNTDYPVLYTNGSTYGYFTTNAESQDVPFPVASTTSISGDYIRIEWGAVSGADSYDVFIDGTYYGSQNASLALKMTINNLLPNTTYGIAMTAWVDGTESNSGLQIITQVRTGPRQVTGVVVSNITPTTARISWTTRSEATSYEIRLLGGPELQVLTAYGSYYNFSGLLPGIEYRARVTGINSEGSLGVSGDSVYFTTTGTGTRPLNWAWEYTIASGQPFYTQSGSTVYIMRASHWNAFTARINEFRIYKLGAGYSYSFTTALTSHTPSQIRACINQAIAAINGMGFSQGSVSIGSSVAASTFTTMRNNLNSIT